MYVHIPKLLRTVRHKNFTQLHTVTVDPWQKHSSGQLSQRDKIEQTQTNRIIQI